MNNMEIDDEQVFADATGLLYLDQFFLTINHILAEFYLLETMADMTVKAMKKVVKVGPEGMQLVARGQANKFQQEGWSTKGIQRCVKLKSPTQPT